MRIVVLVSGRGSNLRALQAAQDAGAPFALVACFSDRPCPAIAWAKAQPLHAAIVRFRPEDRARWEDELRAEVAASRPDLIVLAGFQKILSASFVDAFAAPILNVHPSLLPSFRGTHAIEQALRAKVKLTGCTVHRVDAGVDTGPILAQAAVPVLPGDDVPRLHARIQEAEHALLPALLSELAAGAAPRLNPVPAPLFWPLLGPAYRAESEADAP